MILCLKKQCAILNTPLEKSYLWLQILMALQINNWNENRKNNNEELAILESLDNNLILAKKQYL
jgi:hypothetical protein